MENDRITKYIRAFATLRTDKTGGWTSATKAQAPHKPLLLLSILDLFAQRFIQKNFIEVTPELGDLFSTYWSRIMPPERRGNIALPFFHLRSSGFWHLIPLPDQEEILGTLKQVDTLSQLKKVALGAKMDDDLFEILQVNEARDTLRAVLLETYFSGNAQIELIAQTTLNLQSFVYSQELVEKARKQIRESYAVKSEYLQQVRDQGFRKAIVRIYEHRCAFCGVRLITVDGHSAIDAAHIIPWSLNHNDDLHNGIALCRLCHWTFDEGLLSISAKYIVVVSQELRIASNLPGHLLTLEGRPIITPQENTLYPDIESLAWHRQNIFRKI